MSRNLCPTCQQRKKDREAKQCLHCHVNGRPTTLGLPSDQQIQEDRQKLQQKAKDRDLNALYKEALKTIADQQALLDAASQIHTASVAPLIIEPKYGSGTSEATIVTPASDWHLEERVGAEVGGLNEFNLEIAEKRVTQFFQHSLRLCRLLEQDIKIPTWVLPLLGDFITNDIHDAESADMNGLLPIEAITLAQTWIKSGIDFLLNNTTQRLVIPCHSGNHARTTHKTRFASENGHSLEHFMYANLAMLYANEPRVEVQLPKGIHSYMDIYGQTIRFHHGHALKYGGGVGGIYIPVNKAIAQWNKGRHADLDVFGHFHQLRDGGNFICNGSIIGYNAFAMSIKADYERPRQALFLMDKKRGRTCLWPILFTV